MSFEPKSIEEQIECLARLTGASRTFVFQVKTLFHKKGIPLNSDASPYLEALEEAFQREESIRTSSRRAQQELNRVQLRFGAGGKAQPGPRIKPTESKSPGRSDHRPAIHIDPRLPGGRGLMTPQQFEQLPVVPGPDETQ